MMDQDKAVIRQLRERMEQVAHEINLARRHKARIPTTPEPKRLIEDTLLARWQRLLILDDDAT